MPFKVATPCSPKKVRFFAAWVSMWGTRFRGSGDGGDAERGCMAALGTLLGFTQRFTDYLAKLGAP